MGMGPIRDTHGLLPHLFTSGNAGRTSPPARVAALFLRLVKLHAVCMDT